MNIAPSALTLSRGFLILLYIAAGGIFAIGLQSYILAYFQISLLGEIASTAIQGFARAQRFAGWTLFGFLPLAALLLSFTWYRILVGPLPAKPKHFCQLIELLSYGLGICGSLTHFMIGDTSATSVGAGLGPLLVGLIFWLWSSVICFDLQHFQPAPATSSAAMSADHE